MIEGNGFTQLRGRVGMNQAQPSRASHLPHCSDFFRDRHVTQPGQRYWELTTWKKQLLVAAAAGNVDSKWSSRLLHGCDPPKG